MIDLLGRKTHVHIMKIMGEVHTLFHVKHMYIRGRTWGILVHTLGQVSC